MLRSYWAPGGRGQRAHSSASAGWKGLASAQVLAARHWGPLWGTLKLEADVDGETGRSVRLFCLSVLYIWSSGFICLFYPSVLAVFFVRLHLSIIFFLSSVLFLHGVL